jgi:pimeloyl-ACP methyl ester carboxylesterase
MRTYSSWKRDLLSRLERGSSLTETAVGAVEYGVAGTGDPILISHGSPGGYDQGLLTSSYLDPGSYQRICPSRPGYLRTPLASGATPEEQGDLFAALLDALDIPTIPVMAVSGGGPAAIQFALRHRGRCRGLIMIAAASMGFDDFVAWRELSALQRLYRRASHLFIRVEPLTYLAHLVSSTSPIRLPLLPAPPVIETVSFYRLRRAGYENDLCQLIRLPDRPPGGLGVPALILHGTLDKNASIEHARQLAAVMPSARLVEVPGADHLGLILRTDLLRKETEAFLAGLCHGENAPE